MENSLKERVGKLEIAISTLIQNVQKVNSSIAHGFSKVDENFKITNEKVDAIRGGSTSSLHSVEGKLSDLTTEISKINHVTKYGGIFDNMKIVKDNVINK